MALLLAVLVASVMAVMGTPFRTYESWWSWNRPAAVGGLVLYFLGAGGGAGVVGWLSGRVSGALASQAWWIQGVGYGLAGAALVRAGVRVKPNDVHARGSEVEQTVSALGYVLSWATELLDDQAQKSAHAWFVTLIDDDLLFQSQQIKAHLLRRDISDSVKKSTAKTFVEAAKKVRIDADRDEGRAQLADFCAVYVAKQHMSKGTFIAAGRTQRLPKS